MNLRYKYPNHYCLAVLRANSLPTSVTAGLLGIQVAALSS